MPLSTLYLFNRLWPHQNTGGWGRDPFSRNVTKPTPRRKWYLMTGRRFEFVFLPEASSCIKASWGLHPGHSTHMSPRCACLCGRRVGASGHFHKACRLRITVAGGVWKTNVYSAAAKLRFDKNNAKYNAKNNAKNNPINSKKRKLDLLAKNLQTVQDDATLDDTLKMTAGTSASVLD